MNVMNTTYPISKILNPLPKDTLVWGGDDPFTHTLVVGPTRCGKTSTYLEPMAYEMMLAKLRGEKVGFTIIEPKGDFIYKIYDMAVAMGLEDEVIVLDPLNPNSHTWNVMEGDEAAVMEATVSVLKSMFGKQDAFFSTVQNSTARNVTTLLKRLYNNNLDITTVLENLRDIAILQASVNEYKNRISAYDDLTNFFDNELLGSGQMAEKYRQLVIGLRAQLENITSNSRLKRIITGDSDLRIDEHLREGKILLVNTAAGEMGQSGDVFGMFAAMHIMLATFRREGNEFTRIPHYLIIDEFSQYINPYVARFLSFAASYRVALVAAIQAFSQLEVASGDQDAKSIRNAIMNTTRNYVIYGGIGSEDAQIASEMMSEEEIVSRSRSYDGGILKNILPKMYRDEVTERAKFPPRFFKVGMPRFHCVCKLVQGGEPKDAFLAKGEWIPRNWKELLEEEEKFRRLSETELIQHLSSIRPSILQWKKRALIDATIHELEQRSKIRENLEKVEFSESIVEEKDDDIMTFIQNANKKNEQVEHNSTPIEPIITAPPITEAQQSDAMVHQHQQQSFDNQTQLSKNDHQNFENQENNFKKEEESSVNSFFHF